MAGKKTKAGYDGKIAGLYDLEDTIGRGHFAVVKLARHVFTGERVAVKVIDKTKLDEISRSHLFQEVRCMKLVQHPNVVRLYQVIDTQTKLYLILELGDGGDMYDYIMKHDGGLDEKQAKRYFRQIVEAISYCHKLHVVHRDLKPENVVFFEKLEIVKLTDFGFSNMFNPGKKLETSCGSLAYSAPEILLGDSYDPPAVDVWSLGVILYMLVVGSPPFQEANDSETLTMIMDCKYRIPDHISRECKDLISRMLVREPSQRAALEDIIAHAWLQDGEAPPVTNLPLISRELIMEADHVYVIEKMVEGNIASREEILKSLEKNSYDHLTATYFLLMEKRLRRHQQMESEVKAAAMNQLKKQTSTPSGQSSKPHLEPLSLSPRKHRELKKTKTAPLNRPGLCLGAPSPSRTPPSGGETSPDPTPFVKCITGSMTLDRRSRSAQRKTQSAISPRGLGRKFSGLDPPLPLPSSAPPTNPPAKKSFSPFSKIAVLSSFFERKAAMTGGKEAAAGGDTGRGGILRNFLKKPENVKQRLLSRLDTPSSPCLEAMEARFSGGNAVEADHTLSPKPGGQSGDRTVQSLPVTSANRRGDTPLTLFDSDDEDRPSSSHVFLPKTSFPNKGVQVQGTPGKDSVKSIFVQSLVSPPGAHPSPSSSPKHTSSPGGEKRFALRKCSLIREESGDMDEDGEDMEVEQDVLNPIHVLESTDDLLRNTSHSCYGGGSPHHDLACSSNSSNNSSGSFSSGNPRRPLKSVSSSPQLLNQIFEENESDDEVEDFVPQKLLSPGSAGRPHAPSMASPEILRKFEARKKRRGAGQRGTSCSSSDASDTDDTEGRSRKDKLKHKFVHRRDSSDHSSDTDGPGGHGGGLGGGPHWGDGGGGGSRGDRNGGGGGKDGDGDSGRRDGNGGGRGSSKQQPSSAHHRHNGTGGRSRPHNSHQHRLPLGGGGVNLEVLGRKLSQLSAAAASATSTCTHQSFSPMDITTATSSSSSLGAKMLLQWGAGVAHCGGWHGLPSTVQYLGSSDVESVSEGCHASVELSEMSSISGLCKSLGDGGSSSSGSRCSSDCPALGQGAHVKIPTDINSNGLTPFCKCSAAEHLVKVESKCCSVV